jgi:hypothetical protein
MPLSCPTALTLLYCSADMLFIATILLLYPLESASIQPLAMMRESDSHFLLTSASGSQPIMPVLTVTSIFFSPEEDWMY